MIEFVYEVKGKLKIRADSEAEADVDMIQAALLDVLDSVEITLADQYPINETE